MKPVQTQNHAYSHKSWEFAQPERIDLTRSNSSWTEAARFSEDRLKTLQHIVQTLKQEEEPFITKERNFLDSSVKFLETFSKAITDFVKQEEENIKKIKEEIQKYHPEQAKNDKAVAEMKGAITEIERQIQAADNHQREAVQKKRQIVDQISPAELAKITFKDFQDESNDIFIWVLQSVYKEPKASYEWGNFKKQVFTKDKGVDFMARLRGLNMLKLKKDDFVFAKHVAEKKAAYLADLEKKGKPNNSLRQLMELIEVVSQVGHYHEESENDKAALEEKQKEFEKKSVEFEKLSALVKCLEQKVADSNYYIETLNRLKPSFTHNINAAKERLELQTQYLASLGGNTQAVESMAQSTKSPQKSPTKNETPSGLNDEQRQLSYADKKQTPQHNGTDRNERVNQYDEKAQEEENFEGEQAFSDPHSRKVESRAHQTTDLRESDFANKKTGSCESCSMF